MSEHPHAVRVEALTKRFGSTTALSDISFSVGTGELFGFIGPDGGGKTTLFRILSTLMLPGSGTVTVLGHDVVQDMWALRQRIGYMAGRFSLYPDLSVEENVRFFASVFGTTLEREYGRIEPIYAQLEQFATRRAGALSGGMKQKLALCCALVHRPDLLLLDEPTTGVDAVSRREFWDLLHRLKAMGLTMIVATPYMDEADRCDRVALLQHGRILAIDTPAGITTAYDRPLFAVRASRRNDALRALREFAHTNSVFPFGEVLHYTDTRTDLAGEQIARDVLAYLEGKGLEQVAVSPTAVTIEDSFMAYMGAPEGVEAAA